MDIVLDTSTLIAVIINESERDKIIKLTIGKTLIGPALIPWEIGTAFSVMLRQNRLTFDEAQNCLTIFEAIPFRYLQPNFASTLKIAKQTSIYASDAYFLEDTTHHC